MTQQLQELICTRETLKQVPFLVQKIQLKKQLTSAIVFVFEGQVYAYVNHCMHMQRPLNCEEDAIFDERESICAAQCTVLFLTLKLGNAKVLCVLDNVCKPCGLRKLRVWCILLKSSCNVLSKNEEHYVLLML